MICMTETTIMHGKTGVQEKTTMYMKNDNSPLKTVRRIELLAPAKNKEYGIIAIDHGADAVYIGATSFGARRAAANSIDDIRDLCKYAHIYNAKVYATVNTVIYDHELGDAERLVNELKDAGVDAILLQDMGLLSMVRDKGIEIHASTQTDNRDTAKVEWLRGNGFSRVVLARELSIEEIGKIHRAVPDIELEAFIHGALCVSYSGQCYASEYVNGRSANRGECAQMCRMRYSLKDADGNSIGPDAYYLSLKDQCQIDNIERLLDAGVVSLKIEGRLKDVTYVKNAVAAYSQKIDEIIERHNARVAHSDGMNSTDPEVKEEWRRASWGKVTLGFTPDLGRSYNRGYTTYFADGRQRGMASFMTPKAIGEYVGQVKEIRLGRNPSFNVAGTAPFVNGDGLCFMNDKGALEGFRVNRAEGNRLYPYVMPKGIKPGIALYRSQDKAFDSLLEKKTATRTIPVKISLKAASSGVRMEIDGMDGIPIHGEATLEISGMETAQKSQRENIRRQLTKLGGTPYVCQETDIEEWIYTLFIPSSMLSDLRRRAVSDISPIKTCHNVNRPHIEAGKNQYTAPDSGEGTNPYTTSYRYLYNADNMEAKRFLQGQGITGATGFSDLSARRSAELDKSHTKQKGLMTAPMLMQCKYCIRYEMGYCSRNRGKKPYWKEPLTLSLADGTAFTITFDCKRCVMLINAGK